MKTIIFISTIIFLTINSIAQTVYVTDSGTKYHKEHCKYLKKSSHAISLIDAVNKGYTACKVCNPQKSGQSTGTLKQKSEQKKYKSTIQTQCSGTTKKGTRCKRKTSSPNGKCYQHGGN